MESDIDWDSRYKEGLDARPWDTGIPAPELVEYFQSLSAIPGKVLEIGCGTGTNSLWMAEKGADVIGVDLSPSAIEMARSKLTDKQANRSGSAETGHVRFMVSDVLESTPANSSSVDFVFDRGVYHVMSSAAQRELFAERVAEVLMPGGMWLCVAGCKDEYRDPEEGGPPQLTAVELISPMESLFEIHSLERASFVTPGTRVYLAWKAILRRR